MMDIKIASAIPAISFDELDYGEAFAYDSPYGTDFYIRAEDIEIDGEIRYNAVKIDSGVMAVFHGFDVVRPVNGKFVAEM